MNKDISALKTCIRGLNKSTSPRMLRANLEFLLDRYLWHPAKDLPEHLRSNIKRMAMAALSAAIGFGVLADELKPIKYEAVTNYVRYERDDGWRAVTNSAYAFERINFQTTNAPVAIIHSVTWGRGTNAVFVLRTCEPLNAPEKTNGWKNTEWKHYGAAAWVEGVK